MLRNTALGFHILGEWPKTNNFATLFRERTKLGKTRTKYDAGDLDNFIQLCFNNNCCC